MYSRTLQKAAIAVTMTASLVICISASADDNEIIERVKPVGHLVVLKTDETATKAATPSGEATAVAAETATVADAGKATYDTACFACHGTGAAGAPITGNKDTWASRVGQGIDTLYSHAINGFNAMPPKGGAMNLSDEQVKEVVDYMVGQSS